MVCSETMEKVRVEISAELALAAEMNPADPSAQAARLLAVEVYREGRASLRRAAELCQMSIEQFMEFAARHNASLHYGDADLEEDHRTLERLGL